MSLDKRFLARVISDEDGYQKTVEKGILSEHLIGEGQKVFKFISEYFREYGETPSKDTILEDTGIDIGEGKEGDNITYLCDKISRRCRFNILKKGARRLVESIERKDIEGALEVISESLGDLDIGSERGLLDIVSSEALEMRLEEYQRVKNLEDGIDGLRTGWTSLDKRVLGIHSGDLITVVARTGVGKSFVLLKWMMEFWRVGAKVLFISTEMTTLSLCRRWDAIYSGIPYPDLRRGELSNVQEAVFIEKLLEQENSDNPVWLLGNGRASSVDEIGVLISQLKPDIVIVDGIYKLKAKTRYGKGGLTEKLNEVFGDLKQMALAREIPIVVSTQFNRQVSSNGGSNDLLHIAQSDKISWDSDIVIALYKNDDLERLNQLEIRCLKMREGDPGTFKVSFDVMNLTLDEIEESDISAADNNDIDRDFSNIDLS